MFEQIKVDFQGKPKKLNHRNVKTYADLNTQLKKAYQISSSYSLWYEDQGQLLSIQNQYDFQNLDRSKKLKIIVLAEETAAHQTLLPLNLPPKSEVEEKPNIKQPVKQEIMTKYEQSKCEQCQNFRSCGFTEIVCVDCQKKNMAAMFPPKKEPKARQPDNSKVKEEALLMPIPPRKNSQVAREHQKSEKPAKIIQNRPKIKIQVAPDKLEEFKQDQLKINQFLELFSTSLPVKQQNQNNQQPQINLINIAKIVLNYKPEDQTKPTAAFGKQLSEKYQMMQDIFPNQSRQELLQFIGNHMALAYDDLPNKYMRYKHW